MAMVVDEKTLSKATDFAVNAFDIFTKTDTGKKFMKAAEATGKAVSIGSAGVIGIGAGGLVEGLGLTSAGSVITGASVAAANSAIVAAEAVPVVGPAIASGLGAASSFIYTAAVAAAPVVGTVAAGAAVVAGGVWLVKKVLSDS